jgi:methylated-DNA-[protein]-cysteine S-methyltransferase
MEYFHRAASPLGGITLASDGRALTGLWFDGQRHFAETLSPEHKEADLPVFALTRRWLETYFSGRQPDFTPPLALRATPFREAVWRALLTIPYGRTVSYGALAALVAAQSGLKRTSPRAVGGAVGHNPISLIIPCHRVVGADGGLTGYAGGIDRKQTLLAMERQEDPYGKQQHETAAGRAL